MEYMLTRLEWLVGPDKIQTLKDTSIALFGVGGVGGGALEALVRAGVGRIVIIDGDAIAPSNLNRQMITTHDTIGERKVEVAKARALAINPDVLIETYDIMYTEENYPGFIQSLNVDYVIDAIDMVTAKLNIIEVCQRESIPVISCMGGGNRFYPEKLMIADINKSHTCPLARVMRRELKKRGIKKQLVLFSTEKPTKPQFRGEATSPGTCSFVPPVAGFILAAHVLRTILEVPEHEKAKIHMADGGDIVIELFEKEAPGTVQNFVDLINKGFYNGLRFHRVIPGFVAQGGCPNGNGTGGPGYTIKDELIGNPHKHERGALSMAHRGPNTGGSQFFIVYEPQPHLDGVHTVFGKVIEGMDVVDGIHQGAIMETVEVIEG